MGGNSVSGDSLRGLGFSPGYIQFGVCTPDERKTKGMVYNAAKTWWATLRAELPEEIAVQTAEELEIVTIFVREAASRTARQHAAEELKMHRGFCAGVRKLRKRTHVITR